MLVNNLNKLNHISLDFKGFFYFAYFHLQTFTSKKFEVNVCKLRFLK